jgi:DNA-binding NarL/FixJ family response regulator
MSEIKIIIADDHPIFRGGLKNVIEKEPQLKIVAEAGNGAEALDLIRQHVPDIALLDLDMPEIDGFGVARELQKLRLPVSIVILTMHKDETHFNQAIDLSVRGYVVKDSAASEIVGCLKTVASGREYFSPEVSSFLLSRVRRASSFAHHPGIGDLTPTERRVLFLLAELKTSKQIAADLGVSPRTIENHRAHICQKLELQGSHALVKFALQNKEKLT